MTSIETIPTGIEWTDDQGDRVRATYEDGTGLGHEGMALISTLSGYGEVVTIEEMEASPDYPAEVVAWAKAR